MQSRTAELEPIVDLAFFEQLCFPNGPLKAVCGLAPILKGSLVEPKMQARVHGRMASMDGWHSFRGKEDVPGCVTKGKRDRRSRIEMREMKSEPLVAMYPAYLQPRLIEVFCFGCHRLVGATPRAEIAEILRQLHLDRDLKPK